MPSLTLEKKIVRQTPDLNPVVGHSLVIFETVGEGSKHIKTVLPADQQFEERPGWFSRWLSTKPSYVAYAVNMDENLKLEFTCRVLHKNQVNSFDLSFKVKYSVSDPERIVTRLLTTPDDDPLSRLEDTIKDSISGRIASAEWNLIRDREKFEKVARDAQNESETEIASMASYLGIGVESKNLKLSRRLLGKDIEIEILEDDAQRVERKRQLEQDEKLKDKIRERELDEAELDKSIALLPKEEVLHDAKRDREFKEAGAKTLIKGLDRLADNIDSAPTFDRAFDAARRAFSPPTSQSQTGPTALGGRAPLALAASAYAPTGELGSLLNKAFDVISDITCEPEERNRLLSIILHLFAELLLGDDASDKAVESYAERLKNISAELRYILPEQQDSLSEYLNFSEIKKRLKSL